MQEGTGNTKSRVVSIVGLFTSWVKPSDWEELASKWRQGGIYLFGRFEGTTPKGAADPLCPEVVYIGKTSRSFRSRWYLFFQGLTCPDKARKLPSKYPRVLRYIETYGEGEPYPCVACLPYESLELKLREEEQLDIVSMPKSLVLQTIETELVSEFSLLRGKLPAIQGKLGKLRESGKEKGSAPKTKVLCLVSGGIDSVGCLIKLLQGGHEVQPLFVDYGQHQSKREIRAIKSSLDYVRNSLMLTVPPVRVVKVDMGLSVGDGSRYLMLVGIASLYSSQFNYEYKEIALGVLNEPIYTAGYQSSSLLEVLNTTVCSLLKGSPIKVTFPLVEMTKESLGKFLKEVKFPARELTYSCYWDPPCGSRSSNDIYRCPACRNRGIVLNAMGYDLQTPLHLI